MSFGLFINQIRFSVSQPFLSHGVFGNEPVKEIYTNTWCDKDDAPAPTVPLGITLRNRIQSKALTFVDYLGKQRQKISEQFGKLSDRVKQKAINGFTSLKERCQVLLAAFAESEVIKSAIARVESVSAKPVSNVDVNNSVQEAPSKTLLIVQEDDEMLDIDELPEGAKFTVEFVNFQPKQAN